MRERGQVLGACYSPTRHRPLAPSLCHPTPGRQLSAAGAHLSQPGEGGQLRGHAAAQAVSKKVPVSDRATSRE